MDGWFARAVDSFMRKKKECDGVVRLSEGREGGWGGEDRVE